MTIHPWKTIVYIACFSMAILTSILSLVGPVADEANFFSYYTDLIFGPMKDFFSWAVAFSAAALLIYEAAAVTHGAFYARREPAEFLRHQGRVFFRWLKEFILFGAPVVLTLLFISLSMSYMNGANVPRLMDNQLVGWDHFLTGAYPFLASQNIQYPGWFIGAVRFSFMNLPMLLIVSGFYALFYYREVFQEMAAVFCLSLVLMIFFWQVFPVLSPQDRYIDNVYQLPVPVAIAGELASNYHPGPAIQNFLKEMRESKNQTLHGTMPTSTFPSAHVAWATLIVYCAYRTRKALLCLALPMALFSSIGTVLFAQHYLVDVPAGILVMMFTIWLVRFADKPTGFFAKEFHWIGKQEQKKNKNYSP